MGSVLDSQPVRVAHLRDLPAFVVATYEGDAVRVANLRVSPG